jgi:hypothetical protein
MSVRNALALFLAVSALALLAGCGGTSSPPANTVGFNKTSLTGTYVFSTTGVDNNGAFLAIAGAFVANGNGGIASGTMDVVGVEVPQPTPPATVAQAITGSYNVGTDGRGQATLNSPGGPVKLDFVLTSTSHGLVTEYDSNGTGSGTIDLQTALTDLSQLAGSYAFSFAGVGSAGTDPLATAGAFQFDSTGDIVAGVEDLNDNGLPYLQQGLSNSIPAALGSGTGPGSIILSTVFGPKSFDFYPIDSTHLKFIETDYSEFLAGDAFTQTGASVPVGATVFTMAGGTTNTGPIAVGGLMNSVGDGNFTGGLEDVNDDGTVSQAQLAFSGALNAGLSGSVGGRLVVDLTGFIPATRWVIYPSSGGLLMLEMDPTSLLSGAAYAQTSQTLAAENYGFNLSATNITGLGSGGSAFEEDDIAQFLTASTTFTGIVDVNDEGQTTPDQALSGSFPNTPPVDATGRGVANTTNFVNFVFYVVDSSTVLLLEIDGNQIGAGTFESQTAPVQPGARKAIYMAHPTVGRSHGALRRVTKP